MASTEGKGHEISEEAVGTGIMDKIPLDVYMDDEDLKEFIPSYKKVVMSGTESDNIQNTMTKDECEKWNNIMLVGPDIRVVRRGTRDDRVPLVTRREFYLYMKYFELGSGFPSRISKRC